MANNNGKIMDITRIASVISEQACDSLQELLNCYVETSYIVGYQHFSSFCSTCGVLITEEEFQDLLANNDKYLFSEVGNGWTATAVSNLDLIVEEEFFNYDSVAEPMWDEKFKEAKDKFNVRFDLENDEGKTDRVIRIPNKDDTINGRTVFHCQLRKAGGDWEQSSVYFRCQLWDGHAGNYSKYSNAYFCFIPSQDQGNSHLQKGKKGGWVAPDSDYEVEDEPDEKECWKALHDYLEELVATKDTRI